VSLNISLFSDHRSNKTVGSDKKVKNSCYYTMFYPFYIELLEIYCIICIDFVQFQIIAAN